MFISQLFQELKGWIMVPILDYYKERLILEFKVSKQLSWSVTLDVATEERAEGPQKGLKGPQALCRS